MSKFLEALRELAEAARKTKAEECDCEGCTERRAAAAGKQVRVDIKPGNATLGGMEDAGFRLVNQLINSGHKIGVEQIVEINKSAKGGATMQKIFDHPVIGQKITACFLQIQLINMVDRFLEMTAKRLASVRDDMISNFIEPLVDAAEAGDEAFNKVVDMVKPGNLAVTFEDDADCPYWAFGKGIFKALRGTPPGSFTINLNDKKTVPVEETAAVGYGQYCPCQ